MKLNPIQLHGYIETEKQHQPAETLALTPSRSKNFGLKSVARRIVDRRVLHLIKMWLDCPVEEIDKRGRKTRTTEARDNRCGIPQGSPLSPLLANIYMRRFVLGWKKLGLERSLGTRLVIYADALVIL